MEEFYKKLNRKQEEALSTFFNNIAVAWFVATFIAQHFDTNFNSLTLVVYIVNMLFALGLSLFFLGKE